MKHKQQVSTFDISIMQKCLQLAQQAAGKTSPNPLVGSVIVKDGKVIGEGFHPGIGLPHAEIFALQQAGEAAKGATVYVNLEPCNHYGRTPPCSEALIKAQVAKVVTGMVDPDPRVAGGGIKKLRDAGIEVVVGVEVVNLTKPLFIV
jgi:diaminohydroxyphosphoribosylaminopyrimidine deaminase / 5-amino-6-(5-phosphoribosylamino)uracil reductase